MKYIIQFLPYYPPHKGGLETHTQQWAFYWVKNNYGKVYNIITDINQNFKDKKNIIFEGKTIGYIENEVENLLVPSLEIIPNFPMYKIWTKKHKLIKKYLKTKQTDIIITRTRFFLTSFIGGLYARKHKLKWVYIEHGSDYVKLNSKFKTFIAKVYDKLIGKWIFKKADKLIGVSNACKEFIQKEFINKEVEVIYRGIEGFSENKTQNISENNLKNKFPDKIIVGFVGRLYKWKNVDSLIKACYLLDEDLKNKIQIVVVGDGEDFNRLEKIDTDKLVYFTGGKLFKEALDLQSQFDIHFHTSSPSGGLATTLLQAMHLGCFIVSTPYEGAQEVIQDGKNGILLQDDSIESLKKGLIKGVENLENKEDYALKNKEIIQNQFNWNKNIKKYYDLFVR